METETINPSSEAATGEVSSNITTPVEGEPSASPPQPQPSRVLGKRMELELVTDQATKDRLLAMSNRWTVDRNTLESLQPGDVAWIKADINKGHLVASINRYHNGEKELSFISREHSGEKFHAVIRIK
jgi:hypothetical protein